MDEIVSKVILSDMGGGSKGLYHSSTSKVFWVHIVCPLTVEDGYPLYSYIQYLICINTFMMYNLNQL